MMQINKIAFTILFASAGMIACENRQEKVQKAIQKGNEEVAVQKIEATKELANAERKVDDEKIEATKEITNAEVNVREKINSGESAQGAINKLEKEQLEADREIGKQKQNVLEEKVEAAGEIREAEQKANEGVQEAAHN